MTNKYVLALTQLAYEPRHSKVVISRHADSVAHDKHAVAQSVPRATLSADEPIRPYLKE